ncbi:MAG: MBOAT family protein [Bacteroidales bacterium]|nr:MBOAT family protein [Bacteroidales bacterium]
MKNLFAYTAGEPLLFTQIYFWLFLFVVLLVFALIKNKLKLSHLWLFLVSVFFYYKSSGNFVILLLITTLLTYGFSLWIDKTKSKGAKKLLLFVGIFLDSAFLLYFKYTYFFIDLINTYFSAQIQPKDYLSLFANNTFGTQFSIEKIILPVGISFYTFQAISFLVDKYKRRLADEVSFIDFAFYLTFFPQLVAGPIVRADVFLPQTKEKWQLTKFDFSLAVFLILNGLIKKMFVSDYISINFSDRIFTTPDAFSAMENLLATYVYSLQIYCDFSGYTDIAIGISLLFGFHLPMNFNSPYKAITITDFWHRWHISLSTWLRDYIYIPLGGNRKGKLRQYFNLFLTMLIGGFWHGANLKFIFWGGVHGLLLIVDKLLKSLTEKLSLKLIGRIFLGIITFHLVNTLWIFFRADSFDIALTIIEKSTQTDITTLGVIFAAYWKPLTITLLALIIHLLPKRFKLFYRDKFIISPIWFKVFVVILTVFVLVQVKSSAIQPFIYFQF